MTRKLEDANAYRLKVERIREGDIFRIGEVFVELGRNEKGEQALAIVFPPDKAVHKEKIIESLFDYEG